MEQHRFHQAEKRSAGADFEGHRQDGNRGQAGGAKQGAGATRCPIVEPRGKWGYAL